MQKRWYEICNLCLTGFRFCQKSNWINKWFQATEDLIHTLEFSAVRLVSSVLMNSPSHLWPNEVEDREQMMWPDVRHHRSSLTSWLCFMVKKKKINSKKGFSPWIQIILQFETLSTKCLCSSDQKPTVIIILRDAAAANCSRNQNNTRYKDSSGSHNCLFGSGARRGWGWGKGVAVVITVNAFVKKEKTSRENKKMISPNERPATSQLALINRQLITTQRF